MANVPGAPSILIDCRPFQPAESDVISDYTRGEEIGAVITVPTYAAIDLQAIEQEVCAKARPFGRAFVDTMDTESASSLAVRILKGAFAYAVSFLSLFQIL